MSTEIEVAGIKLRGGKMFLVITILSSLVGALWGGFEFYKDYLNMKEQIQSYVAPDLSGFDKKLATLDEKMIQLEETTQQTNDYVRDIKNDLKTDVRKVESIIEGVERTTKDRQREMDADLRELRKEVEEQIKKALENPLSNMATSK